MVVIHLVALDSSSEFQFWPDITGLSLILVIVQLYFNPQSAYYHDYSRWHIDFFGIFERKGLAFYVNHLPKQGLEFHVNHLIHMKCQDLFSLKNNKNDL